MYVYRLEVHEVMKDSHAEKVGAFLLTKVGTAYSSWAITSQLSAGSPARVSASKNHDLGRP